MSEGEVKETTAFFGSNQQTTASGSIPYQENMPPSFPRPHLLCQLVLVFSRGLLQLCNARLLLLDHGAQVLNAIVVWQFIFGHLQAAVQNETRAEQAIRGDIISSWLIL